MAGRVSSGQQRDARSEGDGRAGAKGRDIADPTQRVETVLNILTTYIAPATALAALVFYFGWTYTRAFWLYFAIDPTILGFANQDYVLRSVNALFPALFVGAALAVTIPPVIRFTDRTLTSRKSMTTIVRIAVGAGGLAAFAAGAVGLLPGGLYAEVLTPVLLVVGTLLLGWMRHLRRVFGAGSPRSLLEAMAFWLLLTLGVFWAVSDFARVAGRGAAQFTGRNLHARPAVTVFSVEELGLEGPGVVLSEEPTPARYRFGYSGLRLLLRTEEQYVLAPEEWEPGGTVFVLDQEPTLRYEFSLPRER